VKESISLEKLIKGDRRTIAKSITLIESQGFEDNNNAQKLLEKILPMSGKSIRVGITGVPGVGKSTFIENFGLFLIKNNFKVAVLAIDPSSPISGGSILGDKTRMEKLSQEENAFIRPSASGGFLGGVAQKTRESILIFEAAGYDFILVETVGVGQSEYEVADMVDFFLVLMLPNAGDELQGIKKGILELADALVINKADGEYINKATQSMAQYQGAIELMRHSDFWKTKILTCSALENKNLDLVFKMIKEYEEKSKDSNNFNRKRLSQNVDWFNKLAGEMFEQRIQKNKSLKEAKMKLEEAVGKGEMLPLTAAEKYYNLIFKTEAIN
jgi:LAO/AO transport system kinase